MEILELRPFNPEKDVPKTSFDVLSVNQAMQAGKWLFVDQYRCIWTGGQREYVGKIRREKTV